MKKRLIVFLFLLVFLLTGCGAEETILGVWEQNMEISILGEGVSESGSVSVVLRFTFREDGTGLQEHILADDKHTDMAQEFTYQLEGESLRLDFGEGQTQEFRFHLNKTTLTLENPRGSYDLTKVK